MKKLLFILTAITATSNSQKKKYNQWRYSFFNKKGFSSTAYCRWKTFI